MSESRSENLGRAGAFFFVGGLECVLGILLAETQYQGYSVANNAISDLGATCANSVCVIHQPSAIIFNGSVILLGALVLAGSYLMRKSSMGGLPIVVALAGVGALGVGLFPETTGIVHILASLVVFLFGGLSAVVSYRYTRAPFSFFSVILGLVSLVALVLYGDGAYLGLGQGGMERMIAYPELLWVVGFGGYLMARQQK